MEGISYKTTGTYAEVFGTGDHHIAVSWDTSTGNLRFYVDGAYQETVASITAAGTGTDGTFVLGQDQDSNNGDFDVSERFAGVFRDVRIFSDIRTDAEIAASYHGSLPYDESGLVANWTFNELTTEGELTDTVSGRVLTVQHASGTGYSTSTPELAFTVEENSLTGTIIGSVSGVDTEREAKITALLAADSELYYNAGTGKFYKVVSGSFDFPVAQAAAESTALNSVNGQLVTVRSASEDAFVRDISSGITANVWLGGTDATVEGEWRWIESGEESDIFWNGAVSGHNGGAYSNWFSATQPNDLGGNEDGVRLQTSDGKWYDGPTTGTGLSYVIEWNADAVLDATDALIYAITSQTVAGAFAIDASTGQISVADGSLLDYETSATHSLTIRVKDVDSNTYDEVFTVSLNDLVESNSAPTDLTSGLELNKDGGNDSYLYLTDGRPVLGGLGQLTVEASFQIDSIPSGYIPIIDYQEGGIATEFGVAINPDGSLHIVIDDGVPQSTTGTYSQLLDGNQHHVAVSWDNTNGVVQFYVDGKYAESITGVGTGHALHNGTVTQLVIGQDADDAGDVYSDNVFSGAIYDLRVWNEVRSAAEISLNYQSKFDGGSLPTGLVANWHMDGFNGSNEVVDIVSANNLSIGHAVGAGFTASTPVEALHISENASNGTSVGFAIPTDPDSTTNVVSDSLFLEAADPGVYTRYTVSQTFGDWTVESGDIDLLGTAAPTSPLGGRSVELNGSTTGTIKQTLSTVAGQQYQLIFEAGGNFSGGQNHLAFRASVDGVSKDFTIALPNGWSLSNPLSNQYSLTFTADSASTDLRFASLNTGAYGSVIADVQVIEVPAAVSSILNNDSTLSYDAATGKFYRAVDTSVSWSAAQTAAFASNLNGAVGELLTIESQYENDLVASMSLGLSGSVWLGASDQDTEGTWKWYEGATAGDTFWIGAAGGSAQPGHYTNWNPSEPSDLNGADFAEFTKSSGQWNDANGAVTNTYIIQWDVSEVLSNFTYTLTDDAGGRFAIDASTGEITVADGSQLDYEANASHDVTVEVTDAAGNSYNEVMTILVNDVFENTAPVISSLGGTLPYHENSGPYLIGAAGSISDADSTNFDGGQLHLQLTVNALAEDVLDIRNQGTAAGQIGINGTNVTYGGVVVGTYTGPVTGSTELVVTFNSNATLTVVNAVQDNLTYENTSENPSTPVRTIQEFITDGDGGTSNTISGGIQPVPANDKPVISTTGGAAVYAEGATPTILDAVFTASDIDSADLDGGTLTVSFSTGGTNSDRLMVTPGGAVTILGNTISHGGTAVATVSGGVNGSPLLLTFNANSTPAIAQDVARQIAYFNVSDNPSTTARTLDFVLTDGDGGTSTTANKSITVTATADAPLAVNDRASLTFDGIDDYVNAGSGTSLEVVGSTLTMEAWVNPAAYNADSGSMVLNREGEYEIGISDTGTLRWGIGNTSPDWTWVDTGYVVPLNTWSHLAVTYDGDVINTYVNGTLVHVYHGTGNVGDAHADKDSFRIGSRENGPAGQYFDGQIDDVRIWNITRTEAQIRSNLDQVLTPQAGLVGYWTFSEGSGTTTSDSSGNVNTGTLVDGGAGTVGPQWLDYRTSQNSQLNISAANGILVNDRDGDGNSLTVSQVNASDAGVESQVTLASGAKVTVGATGTFLYDPNGGFDYLAEGQTGTDSFTYQISDGTGNFDTATAFVTVTGVNDAPRLGNGTLGPVLEDATTPAGAAISSIFNGQFSDVDSDSSFGGIAVVGNTANSTTQGTWEYSTDDTNWHSVGTVADGATALALNASAKLRFVPVANYNGTPTGLVTRGLDNSYIAGYSSGASRINVDTTNNGASTPISGETANVNTSITAVNDAPILSFVGGTAEIPENYGAILLSPSATVSDVDSADFNGGQLVVTITDNGSTEDRLTVRNQGTDAGHVGISGSNVTYQGVVIGNFNGPVTGSTPLTITFNSNATAAIAQAVAQNVTYENISEAPSTATRTLQGYITDGDGGTSNLATGNINNVPANDEQALTTNTGITVLEGSAGNGITTAMLQTTDVDNTAAQIVYTVTSTPSNGGLRLSGVNLSASSTFTQADIDAGLITYLHNGTETTSDSFAFTVDDGAGSTSSGTFNISVTSVNDNTPVITSNGGGANTNINAAENTTTVTTVTASDADLPSQILAYSIIGGTDQALFEIDGSTGVLTFVSGRDRENHSDADLDGIYEVTVQVSDGTLSDTQSISVTITDIDEFDVGSVTDSNATANAVAENATVGTAVGITATASDADATNNTMRYTLDDDAGGLFAIHATTGVVTLNGALDYETATSHSITVRATSSDGSSNTQGFTIQVTDINESAISATSDSDATANLVLENSTVGSVVGVTALATDADGADTVSYALDDDAGGRFAVHATTGVVTVNGAIDREAASSYNITVRATSTDASSTTQVFNIAIGDADEFNVGAVSDSNATANSVAENAAVGTAVGITATASDADATNNTMSYTLDDDAGGLFAIHATTGVVTLNGALDYETATSHSIAVRATSSDGSSNTQGFTINVTDVNESAISATSDSDNTANLVLENVSVGTVVGVTALATDADGADTVSYALDDDAGGRFAIHATTGVVTVNGAIDREAASSYNITVRATSTDASSTTQVFNIAIGDVDEFDVGAVSDSNATANSVAENAAVGTAVGITVTASDNDATNNTMSYTLDDDAGGLFAIHATTGVVTLNGALDYETATSHSIAVRATSSDGSTATQSFTIDVTDANEFAVGAISDSNGTTNAVSEDAANGSSVGLTALASDGDGTNNTITYSLDDDASGRFSIDSSTGVVMLADSSSLDFEISASHDIIVRASSSDGSFQTQVFTISVTDRNDAPIITSQGGGSIAFVNVAEGAMVVTTVVAQDADLPSDVLSFTIIGGADAGEFEIDTSSGQLRFKVAPNFEVLRDANGDGIHDVIVRVADGRGGVDEQTLHVTVTNSNAAPTSGADGDFQTDQVSSLTVSNPGLLANDIDQDGDALTAVLVVDAQHGRLVLNADGSFVYTPNAGFSGLDQFQYAPSDGQTLGAPVTVKITVVLVASSTPASTPSTGASEVVESPPADSRDDIQPKVIATVVPSSAIVADVGTGDASSGAHIAALGIASLSPPSVASSDKSEGDDQPEQAEISFVISGLESAIRNTSRKIGETAARSVHYTSFGLIADTVLSLDFENSANSDQGLLWQKELQTRQLIVGSAAAVSTSLSVGYVVWVLRGGTLVTSLMSSIPAWCSFDPLPIVDSFAAPHPQEQLPTVGESLASIAGPESSAQTTDL